MSAIVAAAGAAAASAPKVTVNDHTFSSTQAGGTSTVALRLRTTGELDQYTELFGPGSYTEQPGEYVVPRGTGAGAAYKARLTKTAGTDPTTGPALGVWHVISTEREWQWVQSGDGSKNFVGTLDIGTLAEVVIDSGTIDVTATVTGL